MNFLDDLRQLWKEAKEELTQFLVVIFAIVFIFHGMSSFFGRISGN